VRGGTKRERGHVSVSFRAASEREREHQKSASVRALALNKRESVRSK
jgi:hypothetical protein